MTDTAIDRVTAELDRLSSLDTVTRHDTRADSFGVGARWAIRMIREAIGGDTHAAPSIHACPPDGSGVTPCCGKTPFEVSRTDRMTTEPEQVTCTPIPTA